MRYIERTEELAILDKAYQSDRLELIMVYGRRRVGKTTLLSHFCQDKTTVYNITTSSNANRALSDLARDISALNFAGSFYIDTFQDALDIIDSYTRTNKLILVLDEFPVMADAIEDCMGKLQKYIDFHTDNKNLKIILCGSSLSFMKHQIDDYQSPLYGRKTAGIYVHPFTVGQAQQLLVDLSGEELVQAYAVCGGIAQYLSHFLANRPVTDQIKELFLSPQGILSNEAIQLLLMEVREPGTYREILEQIANGANQTNKIADKIHRSPAVVSAALNTLQELEIVSKESPTGGPSTRRSGHWIITDSLFACYFRFASPFIGLLDRGVTIGPYAYFDQHFPQYLGTAFETICRSYLSHQPYPFTAIGKWWGPNPITKEEEEIDIVAVTLDGTYHTGECKWTERTVDTGVYDTLKSRTFLIAQDVPCEYWLFSKTGFSLSLSELARHDKHLHLVGLNDILL